MKATEAKSGDRVRGRPRNADLDAQIRNVAWKLIAKVGCAGLTFEAIAQSIGCSRSTLYRRFTSKADLVLNLLDETALSFAPQFAIDAPPKQKLLAHARTCVTMYRGDRGAAFIQIVAASRSDPAMLRAVRAHGTLILPHYYGPLSALAPHSSERAILFAVHTLIGSIIHHVAARGDPPSDVEIERLVDVAVHLAGMSG